MRKLIILTILLCFPALVSGADLISESTVIAKPSISDRVKVRIEVEIGTDTIIKQKIADKVETDTSIKEKKSKIVDEEVSVEVAAFAKSIEPIKIDVLKLDVLTLLTLPIDQIKVVLAGVDTVDLPKLAVLVYDFGYQARELNKTFLSVQESERLKKVLRLIPSKQWPAVTFPFLETTNDDPAILTVDVSKWFDINKLQDTVRSGNYKLVMLMSDLLNNCSTIELGDKVENYPLHGKEFEIVYQAVKQVNPDVPVGFITVMFPEMEAWLSSFTIQPDVWLLFNVPTFGAGWQKVKNRWFKDRPVVANLNHHFQYHNYGGQEYGSVQYNETITKLKSLGFSGAIWWRTK